MKPNNPEGKRVVPLLLLHGWPGSVREFYDFIPLLTNPNDKSPVAFEVIAPSLPGKLIQFHTLMDVILIISFL